MYLFFRIKLIAVFYYGVSKDLINLDNLSIYQLFFINVEILLPSILNINKYYYFKLLRFIFAK